METVHYYLEGPAWGYTLQSSKYLCPNEMWDIIIRLFGSQSTYEVNIETFGPGLVSGNDKNWPRWPQMHQGIEPETCPVTGAKVWLRKKKASIPLEFNGLKAEEVEDRKRPVTLLAVYSTSPQTL